MQNHICIPDEMLADMLSLEAFQNADIREENTPLYITTLTKTYIYGTNKVTKDDQ